MSCQADGSEEQAELYAKIAQVQRDQGIELIEWAAKDVGSVHGGGPPRAILDFGCGTAPLARSLLALMPGGGLLVCVDPDAQRVERARSDHEEEVASGKLIIAVADDSSLPAFVEKEMPGLRFDLILVNFVIHWVADKRRLFETFASISHPGALLLVQSPEYLVPLHRRVTEMMADRERGQPILQRFHMTDGVKETAEAADASGTFAVQQKSLAHVDIAYPSLGAYLNWWKATSHGAFDPDLVPAPKLAALEEEYAHGPCVVTEPTFRMMLVRA